MDLKIIVIYCCISDYLDLFGLSELNNHKMTHAEVVTFVILAAMFFHGNHETARQFLYQFGYIPNMLSKSQLNRRIHIFDDMFWQHILGVLSKTLHHFEETNEYLVDSFPVSACDTSRIMRAKIFTGKSYLGYSSTRQRYFYGIKVHMITSKDGVPIEVVFRPGSEHDMKAFKRFNLDLPKGSILYADRAYIPRVIQQLVFSSP